MTDSISTGVAYRDAKIVGGSVDDTPIGATTPSTAAVTSLGVYGTTPVSQRAYSAAVHNTTGIAVSASFGATQLAALQEVQKTLIGLGIYATS